MCIDNFICKIKRYNTVFNNIEYLSHTCKLLNQLKNKITTDVIYLKKQQVKAFKTGTNTQSVKNCKNKSTSYHTCK